jgi:hypothetical protein
MPDCFLTAAERSDPTAQSQLFSKGEPLFPSSVWEKACTADIKLRAIPRGFFARRSLSNAELRIWILFSAFLRVVCVKLPGGAN